MKASRLLLIILLTQTLLISKDWEDYITSVETSYVTYFTYGKGIAIKANYHYYQGKSFNALWGISLLYHSVSIDNGQFGPTYSYPDQSVSSITTNTQLNFYAGSNFYVSDNFSLIGDLYTGMFLLNISGSYTNSTYSINESTNTNRFFLDYGARVGFAYDITDDWSIQMTLLKSFRNLFDAQLWYVWLVGSDDAPSYLNFGVRYYF